MYRRDESINPGANTSKSEVKAAFAEIPIRSDFLDSRFENLLKDSPYSKDAIRSGRIDLLEDIYVQKALRKALRNDLIENLI